MLSVLGFSDRRTKLGGLVLDVLTSEEIELPSQVSRYPVEDGTTISDHITQGSEIVRISGSVSTADVVAFSFATTDGFSTAGNAAKLVEAVDTLRAMHKARALVSVSTGQMLYEGMAFESLTATRSNSESGNWLDISATLVKVTKVTLKRAEVPEDTARAPASGRAGATKTPAGNNAKPATAKPGVVKPATAASATPPSQLPTAEGSFADNFTKSGSVSDVGKKAIDVAKGVFGF